MKKHLRSIIKYLKGDLDIFNGNYKDTINLWDQIWDEMIFLGYNPETIPGIEGYIREVL